MSNQIKVKLNTTQQVITTELEKTTQKAGSCGIYHNKIYHDDTLQGEGRSDDKLGIAQEIIDQIDGNTSAAAEALQKAGQAVNTANAAETKADTAISTANSASTTATNAMNLANSFNGRITTIENNTYLKGYTHDQAVAATTWIVNHNLDRYPSIMVVDSAGSRVDYAAKYINSNTCELYFNAAFTGTAYLN